MTGNPAKPDIVNSIPRIQNKMQPEKYEISNNIP